MMPNVPTEDGSSPLRVIIPTVGAPSLDGAVESVRRQTLPVGVVLVDDRSRPEKPLESQFPSLNELPDLRVLTTGGVGLARARNFGLDAVSDGAVLLLDDDDVWCPHHAARLAEAFATRPAAFAWSGSRVVTWGDETKVTTAGFGWDNVGPWLWSTNFIPPSSVLFSATAGLRFDSTLTDLEDWDAWLQLYSRSGTEPVFTGVVTMGYGRNIVVRSSMTMSATFQPLRQASMSSAYEAICAAHPIPPGVPDHRDEVRMFRRSHVEQANPRQPLGFDYYERALESLVGRPTERFCCDFYLGREFDKLPRARDGYLPGSGKDGA